MSETFHSVPEQTGGSILRMRDLATRHDRDGNLIRRGETGLSKATIYRKIAEGEFPRPIRLSTQAVGWRQADIDRWKAERPNAD